jgi:mono/diheme cytochrome c family protein
VLFRPSILFVANFVVAALAQSSSAPAAITFNEQIAPILQKHCQGCHRSGEVAPMAFTDFRTTRPWARAIKEAVLSKKMPPWPADPAYSHFANDRRLDAAEIRALVDWVDAGAPEGSHVDSPRRAVPPVLGWNIRPDVVLKMDKPYPVPATGALQYAYIIIPTGFTWDTWVTAAEIRSTAPSVVHHINAIVRPPGAAWLRDVQPGVPYVPDAAAHDGEPDSNDPQAGLIDGDDEFLAGYAPGMQAQRFDTDHSAKMIPAGSDIVLQVHHTANGKTTEEDLISIGLSLAAAPPEKRFYSATAVSWHWEIPPGDPHYEGHASLTFGEPVELVFIQPHMHLRGKDVTVRLVTPGAPPRILLSVPKFSFSWQLIYYLAEPLQLPKGSKIEIVCHWDNSADNPFNPDPKKAVKWGNQSWDEMLTVNMGVITGLE